MAYRLRCRQADHDVAAGWQTSHPHFDETGKTSRLGDLNQVGDHATAVVDRGVPVCLCAWKNHSPCRQTSTNPLLAVHDTVAFPPLAARPMSDLSALRSNVSVSSEVAERWAGGYTCGPKWSRLV